MALKRHLPTLCVAIALAAGAVLVSGAWRGYQLSRYNQAIGAADYAAAAAFNGDFGAFAAAYGRQREGEFQQARELYAALEQTAEASLQTAVPFNLANTYLQQATRIDVAKDADQALPLIELAKVTYRQVLSRDPGHWGAKYNLERALQLLPDSRDLELPELDGLRGGVRAVISPDTENNLP